MSKVRDLHQKWSRDPAYRGAYDDLDAEFTLTSSLIEARLGAGLTQAQLAERMGTTQSVVARIECGRGNPSTRTLEAFARSTGTRLRISFEPIEQFASTTLADLKPVPVGRVSKPLRKDDDLLGEMLDDDPA